MFRKVLPLILAICLISLVVVNCTFAVDQNKHLNVLCSFHPIYVFAQNVVTNSKNVTLDCLLPPNTGPHDYALTPGDMKRLAKADLFIINGLEVEEFLGKAVNEANPNLKVIDTSEGIKPIVTRGAEENLKADHHGKYNPHVWASPKSAIIQVRNIQKALSIADPANAVLYKSNADKYTVKLQAIANGLTKASKTFKNRKIVTFHDAFDYFARDFGLEVVDVIEVVPGQEPSAGEMANIVKKVKESGVSAIFSEPQYSEKVANVLAKEAGVSVYQLDPCHTGDAKPDAYERAMRKNLDVLKKALGGGK
ncbi:MAG: Zinc transporter substrate-binding protein [Candidatus Poribacteria bacterium]|nr:Zinc transporter substrate-binding protein [Candidatus Poribacteria bacterium]